MSREQALKAAESFVLKHKDEFKKGRNGVTNKEIRLAVQKVARALQGIHAARA